MSSDGQQSLDERNVATLSTGHDDRDVATLSTGRDETIASTILTSMREELQSIAKETFADQMSKMFSAVSNLVNFKMHLANLSFSIELW